jgi:uncharacterized membrane protein YdjX (TVP38/TMEM64 family)
MRRRTILRLTAAAVVAAVLLAAPHLPGVGDAFAGFRAWLRELGPWGPLLLAAVYTPLTLLLLPAWPLTVGAGAAFGLLPALAAVSAGSTLAAAVAFLLSRTLLRAPLERRLRGRPWFAPLDRAVAQRGFTLVLLTRLSPLLPFGALNYAFGLTRVRFGPYLLASWLGMLPGTLAYVAVGAAAAELSAAADLGRVVLIVVGVAAVAAVAVLLTRLARRAIEEGTNHRDT